MSERLEFKPRRRWLQFSLRTLLVLVLLISLPLGWLAYQINLIKQQRAAVAEINRLGGSTMQCHLLLDETDPTDGYPRWLSQMLGDDYFETINYAQLNGQNFNDENLAVLSGLPQLRSLSLCGTKVTDQGLAHLRTLVLLSSLHVEATAITDRGLVELSKLPMLSYLTLSGSGITDAGLVELGRCQNLEFLDLENTQTTAAGIEALKKALPALEVRR